MLICRTFGTKAFSWCARPLFKGGLNPETYMRGSDGMTAKIQWRLDPLRQIHGGSYSGWRLCVGDVGLVVFLVLIWREPCKEARRWGGRASLLSTLHGRGQRLLAGHLPLPTAWPHNVARRREFPARNSVSRGKALHLAFLGRAGSGMPFHAGLRAARLVGRDLRAREGRCERSPAKGSRAERSFVRERPLRPLSGHRLDLA
jgi:hypothetical protein